MPMQAPEGEAWSPAESAHGGDDKAQPVLNVVVCGTLMAAYEQAGKWRQVRHKLTATRRRQCIQG